MPMKTRTSASTIDTIAAARKTSSTPISSVLTVIAVSKSLRFTGIERA